VAGSNIIELDGAAMGWRIRDAKPELPVARLVGYIALGGDGRIIMWPIFKWFRPPPDAHLFRDCDDLDLGAFRDYPAWIDIHLHDFGDPAYERVDEGMFRPWNSEYPVPRSAVCLFHAILTSASNREFDGVISHIPEGQSSQHAVINHAPALFLSSGRRVHFWHGMVYGFGDQWLNEDKQSFYDETGLTPDEAFPMRYGVSPRIIEGGITGEIPGFGYLESMNKVAFVV
jgi:hypothetical protein